MTPSPAENPSGPHVAARTSAADAPAAADAPLLELANATVVRDGRAILTVDHFTIRQGEHLAILGPNGCGKSTLIKLLTRDILPLWIDPPPVLFCGKPRIALEDARKLLGVVSAFAQEQADVMLPALDVVLGGFFGSLGVPRHQHPTPQQQERALSALAELEVSHLAERLMTTLSTGEARRVLFARALVHDPAVLVLDEPTNGLDPHASYHVRQAVRSLARGGRSLVLVTHHVEDIAPEIDRVVMLRDSRIVADGAKSELLTTERLGSLFDIPAKLEERDGEYRLW
jgi:iron complex transport system ATP-binding protein